MKITPVVVGSLVAVTSWTGDALAQLPMCPPEVASAKAMLNARGGDDQASRSHGTLASRSWAIPSRRARRRWPRWS